MVGRSFGVFSLGSGWGHPGGQGKVGNTRDREDRHDESKRFAIMLKRRGSVKMVASLEKWARDALGEHRVPAQVFIGVFAWVVVLDACYGGAVVGSTRSRDREVAWIKNGFVSDIRDIMWVVQS